MMTPNRQQLDKSRLGRLLVNRGYISDEQLQQALQVQGDSGERLGEILMRAGWISSRELNRTLKHQSRYRYTAAFAAMVVAPLQPAAALASPAPALPTAGPTTTGQQMRDNAGMTPLSESEMQQVSGQGSEKLFSGVTRLADAPASGAGAEDQALDSLEMTARTFLPVFNFLDSDVTVTGVDFGEKGPGFSLLAHGGLSINMPERIEEIRMERIRVEGSPASHSMGSITMSNIRFSSDSQLTIRTR